MSVDALTRLRTEIRSACLASSADVLHEIQKSAAIDGDKHARIVRRAVALVERIRSGANAGLTEAFLVEYGLSTDEGIALMCLAEALLRVPDARTIDELIEDKIAPSSWGEHLGKSSSSLVNASTWALMLTGKVLDDDESHGVARVLHGLVKRVGEPIIRTAVKRAMKELGEQFVLGETINDALERSRPEQQRGYTYSYDMLGEAAVSADDAQAFFDAYQATIHTLGESSPGADIRDNPGISIKLSALHPRYEVGQRNRVMTELVSRTLELTLQARQANIGLNIDAEESERLDLSLDVIEAVLSDERLAGWHGFGVVVQAYGKRVSPVLDWLYALASKLDRKIMVRLVKGAYWDSEIKRAQVEGLRDFPVFSRKAQTDVAYLCTAQKLLAMTDRIYPQFATHNAHTVCAILEFAADKSTFEFQRLHGMGESLHEEIVKSEQTRCRIYAPVGAHRDLLAYLVRRLLENGANSSFVNQIVDTSVPALEVAADPFERLEADNNPSICNPAALYAPQRQNSRGWDLHNEDDLSDIETARSEFKQHSWSAGPLLAVPMQGEAPEPRFNPADENDAIGQLVRVTEADMDAALDAAKVWTTHTGEQRAEILTRASELYEANFGELFAALCREAGKNPLDAIAELREAVDFLRYYATRIETLADRQARGVIACISPWNFPLAIFTGQIAAALAGGNGVLAKPADPTPIIASVAVRLLHEAGVPRDVLQLVVGKGSVAGARLTSDVRIAGICFTGSTATATTINTSMAEHLAPAAPLIAETGGLNAMIVDSTALPEQAVKDIIASAFQSAGQRCSALRILFLQEDIADSFEKLLFGAMDELVVGNPWAYSTDVGPVINAAARDEMDEYIDAAAREDRVVKRLSTPAFGNFVAPTVIKVRGLRDLEREVFGPVLHITTFRAEELDAVVGDINASGYGLTFGLHTRIDDRVEKITASLNVGNVYINRNQIGAIVGSQPFGGEGLSGTGPKAGGPHYVKRFTSGPTQRHFMDPAPEAASVAQVQAALDALIAARPKKLFSLELPGPTGESNRLSLYPRGPILCLGPTLEAARQQAQAVRACGGIALVVAPNAHGSGSIAGTLPRDALMTLRGIAAVALWSEEEDLRAARQSLARREGPLVALVTETDLREYCLLERHVCIDTTAAGGNASLLAASDHPRGDL